MLGNDEALAEQVQRRRRGRGRAAVAAAAATTTYTRDLESKVADLKNVGAPAARHDHRRAVPQEFVGDGIPWAHLDIAGPAFGDSDDGELSAGGTGFGVRTLARVAPHLQAPVATGVTVRIGHGSLHGRHSQRSA